jgi:hypothetical protein
MNSQPSHNTCTHEKIHYEYELLNMVRYAIQKHFYSKLETHSRLKWNVPVFFHIVQSTDYVRYLKGP